MLPQPRVVGPLSTWGRVRKLRKNSLEDLWWEPPHSCGAKERFSAPGKAFSLIVRFSAGRRELPGLKPILKSFIFTLG